MAFLLATAARAFQISLLTLIRIQSFYLMSATHQLCCTKLNSNKMTSQIYCWFVSHIYYALAYYWALCEQFWKYRLVYIYLLKTEQRILDFQHFHCLAGHRLSAHIPALPNMVNERINKESWIIIFPRSRQPLTKKNRLAAELTSRISGTGPKSKWNLPLHCSKCFRMAKTIATIVIKKFFS